jgi:hypothetical protein
MLSRARHSMSMAVIGTLALLTASAARSREPAAFWFAPDPETPDYTDLFTKPQLSPKARLARRRDPAGPRSSVHST